MVMPNIELACGEGRIAKILLYKSAVPYILHIQELFSIRQF